MMQVYNRDAQPAWNICPPVGARLRFFRDGRIVQESSNLRGLISRAHKVGVHAATIFKSNPVGMFGPAEVFVEYQDGSTVRVRFAEFGIALAFFRKRWRKWGLYAEVRNSNNYWSFI